MANVSTLVKSIQNIMRKDAGTYGDAQRLEQLGWMFFLKIFDDREKELELLRDDYASPLAPELRWCNWAADEEGITGDVLLDFVNNTLLPRLKNLVTGGDRVAGAFFGPLGLAHTEALAGTPDDELAVAGRIMASIVETLDSFEGRFRATDAPAVGGPA